MVTVPVRHLNLHEYQSKNLMAKYGVRVQKVRHRRHASCAHSQQARDFLLERIVSYVHLAPTARVRRPS